MPRATKQITLSKKQIERIKEALRLYDRNKEQVVVTETTVQRRRVTETDKYNRTLKRYTNAFEDADDRRMNWSRWSHKRPDGKSNMPRSIEKMAQAINMKKGYDPYAAYGYMIVYYAYTEETSIDNIERQFVVEDNDGELYRRVTRKVK